MKSKKLYRIYLFTAYLLLSHFASAETLKLSLHKQPGFFRISFDTVRIPQKSSMGLIGLNYFAELNQIFYAGIGTYGAITGTQGGLFTLGIEGGWHKNFFSHWWADAGMYVGGGGGKASLVGGGLLVHPHAGMLYEWHTIRLGLHYGYFDFVQGKIRSQQVGLDLEIPTDFYYVPATEETISLFKPFNLLLPMGNYLHFQRNDFALLLQAYPQRAGTQDTSGAKQDGTIKLIGAELDHYVSDHIFASLKAAGAFGGIYNGYMDILGGVGYRHSFFSEKLALLPQLGIGAGGGGRVDTGGGLLLQPQLGLEWFLTPHLSARISGGYLWAPQGTFKTVTATGALFYQLDNATLTTQAKNSIFDYDKIQNWRVQLLNQTYLHPQRNDNSTYSAIHLVAIQLDQLLTSTLFLSYQAASAYSGDHAGGYASGMVGIGIQAATSSHKHLQPFAELFVGAGGGGGLALGGGSIVEPMVGVRYALTPAIDLQTSVGQLKALHSHLNTPVINLGLTIHFGMLDHT